MNSKVLYIMGFLGLAFPTLASVTIPLIPSGEAWVIRFAPKAFDYYWDYGVRLHIDLIKWNDIGIFGSLLYGNTAGYDATQEVTHFDPIYAYYHQAVGIDYRHWGATGFIAIHRDCLHDIDRDSHLSEFWTTVRIGVGNFNPYQESAWRAQPPESFPDAWVQVVTDLLQDTPKLNVRFLYSGWAGPTLGPGSIGILHENNSYKGEVAAILGVVGSYGKTVAAIRGFSRIQWSDEPSSPHHEIDIRMELGRESSYGSIRIIYGRRFRDTRPIRPSDQKGYWGARYIF